MKRNVTKEIKTIARERVGRVKAGKMIVPKTKRKAKYVAPLFCDAVMNGHICQCPIEGGCIWG